MRMRKIPWAEEYLETSPSLVRDPKQELKDFIDPEKRLHVEIGAGKGGFSAELASAFPNEQFLAFEKNLSAAALAARLFDGKNNPNLKLLHADGEIIDTILEPESVDVIHLNFSDPWPKRRNHKRRLSAPSFLQKYISVLKDDGVIVLKTDNAGFFNDSLLQLLASGFVLQEVDINYKYETNPQDQPTEYEMRFRARNEPIYYVRVARPAKGVNDAKF